MKLCDFGDSLHSCFLLLSGSRAAILTLCLIKLPRNVEREIATTGIVGGQFSDAINGHATLVCIENVIAPQISSELTERLEIEISLNAHTYVAYRFGHAEIVIVTFGPQLQAGIKAELRRELDIVVPH